MLNDEIKKKKTQKITQVNPDYLIKFASWVVRSE